eukprot:jgi/Mesen1/2839/ME000174S02088
MSAPPPVVQQQSAGPPAVNNPSAAAARAFFGRLQDNVKLSLAQQRPWQEMVDRGSFARPDSLAEATNRIKKNLAYFRVNYGIILAGVVVLSMLWNPISIFWLAVLAGIWTYLFLIRTEPVIVYGRALSEREKFVLLLALTVVITFGLTNVGSILMSGIIIGAAAISVHGACRVPDDLFLDDQDAGGFLSFLGPSNTLPTTIGHV